MAERTYRITVDVRCADDIEDGTLACLLGMVSTALTDGDVPPVRLSIEETPDD